MRLEKPSHPTTRYLKRLGWAFLVLNLAMGGVAALLYPVMGLAAVVLFPGVSLFLTLLLALLWGLNYLVSRWMDRRDGRG
jgi:protein-S-isoprenylcysteine O-methyltransferase Ste14